jgi:hypothetical protein
LSVGWGGEVKVVSPNNQIDGHPDRESVCSTKGFRIKKRFMGHGGAKRCGSSVTARHKVEVERLPKVHSGTKSAMVIMESMTNREKFAVLRPPEKMSLLALRRRRMPAKSPREVSANPFVTEVEALGVAVQNFRSKPSERWAKEVAIGVLSAWDLLRIGHSINQDKTPHLASCLGAEVERALSSSIWKSRFTKFQSLKLMLRRFKAAIDSGDFSQMDTGNTILNGTRTR